jgi:hypothetical protein
VSTIFRDNDLNRRFIDDGYVVVPFLVARDVARLHRFFSDLHPDKLPAFYPSVMHGDVEYRKAVRDELWTVFEPKIAAMFDGYRSCIAGFISKEPRPARNEVPLHVDPSFADESQYMPPVTIWCPLHDVTAVNGCLRLVPGSHHYAFPVRSISPTGAVGHPFNDVLLLLKSSYAQTVEAAAGQAVIHSSKLLHGSGQNKSNDRRIAAVCIISPQEAPLRHSVPVSPTEAEVFEVDESFFWTHQLGTRPTGAKSLGVIEQVFAPFGKTDVQHAAHLRLRRPRVGAVGSAFGLDESNSARTFALHASPLAGKLHSLRARTHRAVDRTRK